tara:strand:+ start:499 stop:1425 length:927 start_codon:yes stop_codon:yes gene_type:complete
MKKFSTKVNYWKSTFDDLKTFDEISLEILLERIHNTFKSFGSQFKGGKFINFESKYNEISHLKKLHEKYNINPTNGLIYETPISINYPYGKNPFRGKYDDALINTTCNYQFRDGVIKSPFEMLDLYESHYQDLYSRVDGNFIYFTIPFDLIKVYLEKTNNGWDVDIPRMFISNVKDWNDVDELDSMVDEYDKKYPNWNHDWPIWCHRSILQKGLVMPNTNFSIESIFTAGSHRLFMCGECEIDYPIFSQIPYETKRWTLTSSFSIFKGNKFLSIDIDLLKKEIVFYIHKKLSDGKHYDKEYIGWLGNE